MSLRLYLHPHKMFSSYFSSAKPMHKTAIYAVFHIWIHQSRFLFNLRYLLPTTLKAKLFNSNVAPQLEGYFVTAGYMH